MWPWKLRPGAPNHSCINYADSRGKSSLEIATDTINDTIYCMIRTNFSYFNRGGAKPFNIPLTVYFEYPVNNKPPNPLKLYLSNTATHRSNSP